MPVIKFYKTTTENIGWYALGDEVVTVAEFKSFVSGLTLYEPWSYNTYFEPVYGWSPGFPCAAYVPCTSILEEALYRSNYRMVHEEFKQRLGLELESGTSDTFEIPADNKNALALACRFELDLSDYPVVDEQDYSDLESELTSEAFEDYGKQDTIEKLCEMSEEFKALLINEDGEIYEDWQEIADPAIEDMARGFVGYCGEMYASADSIRDSIQSEIYPLPLEYNAPVAEFISAWLHTLKVDKAIKDQEVFEQTQPPLINVPREDS